MGPFEWEEKIKNTLKGWGFTELYTYSMQSGELIEKTGLNPRRCLRIKNPLTQELEYMRTSLIPSLLQVIAFNQDNFKIIKVFEMANIYLRNQKPKTKNQKLPEEKQILIGAITGKDKFLETKGIVEALFEELSVKGCLLEPLNGPHAHDFPIWHPGKTALIYKNKHLLGIIGEIHPQILENFGIDSPVAIFNIDLQALVENATDLRTYSPPLKYPPIIQDLSFVVPKQTYVGPILQLISAEGGSASGGKAQGPLVQSVKLINSFNQTKTFRITFQHPERNLTDKEVEKIRKKIIKKVENKFNARLK